MCVHTVHTSYTVHTVYIHICIATIWCKHLSHSLTQQLKRRWTCWNVSWLPYRRGGGFCAGWPVEDEAIEVFDASYATVLMVMYSSTYSKCVAYCGITAIAVEIRIRNVIHLNNLMRSLKPPFSFNHMLPNNLVVILPILYSIYFGITMCLDPMEVAGGWTLYQQLWLLCATAWAHVRPRNPQRSSPRTGHAAYCSGWSVSGLVKRWN